MRDPNYIGIVDFHEDDEEEEKPRFCSHCLEYGFQVRLGLRILEKGQPIPPDHDQFLQCHSCGTISPSYEAKYEQNLEGFAQTSDNPFDDQKGVVLGIPKRTTEAGRKATAKRKRERNRAHHKDPEIDTLLRIYGEDNVHIIQDTDP